MPVCRVSSTNSRPSCCMPIWSQPLRVRIDREARRLAGYRYGRQIADDYMRLLARATVRCCAGWRRRKIRV